MDIDHGLSDVEEDTRVGSTTTHHRRSSGISRLINHWSYSEENTYEIFWGSTKDFFETLWGLFKIFFRFLLVTLLVLLLWSCGSYLLAWIGAGTGTKSLMHGVGSVLNVGLNGIVAGVYFISTGLRSMTPQLTQHLDAYPTITSSLKTEPESAPVVSPVTQTIIQYIQKDSDDTLAALKSAQETMDDLKLQISSMRLLLKEHGVRLNENEYSLAALQLKIEKIRHEIKESSSKEKSSEQIIEEVFSTTVGVTSEGAPVSLKTMFAVLSQKEEKVKQPCPTHELEGLRNEDIEAKIKRAIAKYDADKTGKPDFALESAGGSILSTRCTKSSELRNSVISFWGFRLWSPANTPRTIIQPGVVPGECWAFEGSVADVVIKLAVPAIVSGFTVEHIPKSVSQYGHINSAPRHFQVLGFQTEQDITEVHDYGSFIYEDNGEPLQYFPVVNKTPRHYPIVELKIMSNHGNMGHTCIYRFRVHGEIDLTRFQNSGGGGGKVKSPSTAEESDITINK